MWAVVCLNNCDQRIHVSSSLMAHRLSYSVLPCSFLLVADRMIMSCVTLDATHQKHTETVSPISKKFYTGKPFCWLPVCLEYSCPLDLCIWELFLLKISLITIDLKCYSREKCVSISPVSQKHELKRNVIKSLNCKIKTWCIFKIELTILRNHQWIMSCDFIFCLAQTNSLLNVRDLEFWPSILYKQYPWIFWKFREFAVILISLFSH